MIMKNVSQTTNIIIIVLEIIIIVLEDYYNIPKFLKSHPDPGYIIPNI